MTHDISSHRVMLDVCAATRAADEIHFFICRVETEIALFLPEELFDSL